MRFTRERWPEQRDDYDPVRNSAKWPTQCLSWLFTVWSPSGDSAQATSSSTRSFARMPFRHPTEEAVSKDSRLLAEHQFRHSRSMPAMFDLRQASVRTVKSCRPHMDVTWEAVEPPTYWSCHQLSGVNWLVVTDACTKYRCIHATQSVSAKSTIKLLQEDFLAFWFST